MNQLLTRPEVARRLGVAERTSYRLVPATPSRMVRSDAFVRAVNAAAANGQPAYDESGFAPVLDTPETLAYHFGVTPGAVRRWTRRAIHPAPCFDFGRSILRFDRETVEQWTRGITNYTKKGA